MLQARLRCPYCNNLADFALTMTLEFQTVINGPAAAWTQMRQLSDRAIAPA